MNRYTILFLAANPSDSTPLRLDEEIRTIDEKIRRAEFRDVFEIKQHWAVRVADIQEFFLRYKPDIVHFSGHGSTSSEIILEDDLGNSRPVSVRALSGLFSTLKDNIRCVVLNACYSEEQARAIAEHIECVIGMSRAITDPAAISFASSFYQALGYGRSVQDAYELARLQIDMEGLDEQDTPQLLALSTDPREIVFQTVPEQKPTGSVVETSLQPEELGEPAILIVGSGVGEKVLQLDAEPRLGRKQTLSKYKELYGGSGVNYTLRLGHAGYHVLPILSIGNDTTGGAIKKKINDIIKHEQITKFVSSDGFHCDKLSTPQSTVLVAGGLRTIFTGKLTGFEFFKEFVQERMNQLNHLDQLTIKAVMVGHIYADSPALSPDGQEGQITVDIIDKYADQGVMVFTNFGRSQYELGNEFWRETLQKVTVFQLALDEVRAFFGQDGAIKSLREMVEWFQANEITAIITMDKVGAIATLKGGEHGVIFARPYDLKQRLVDSTGAGDAFGAGLVSYFVDKIIDIEQSKGIVGKDNLAQVFTIGNFTDAIERARNWAAHCCTTLGAADKCPDTDSLDQFRRSLGKQASAVVKKGKLNDFDDIMWFIDKTY